MGDPLPPSGRQTGAVAQTGPQGPRATSDQRQPAFASGRTSRTRPIRRNAGISRSGRCPCSRTPCGAVLLADQEPLAAEDRHQPPRRERQIHLDLADLHRRAAARSAPAAPRSRSRSRPRPPPRPRPRRPSVVQVDRLRQQVRLVEHQQRRLVAQAELVQDRSARPSAGRARSGAPRPPRGAAGGPSGALPAWRGTRRSTGAAGSG